MRALIQLVFLFMPLSVVLAQSAKMSSEQYIIMYKEDAIIEMYRTGVPASITLAQGILESQNGNSRLAKEANNHFGIKCKTGWTGKTITADDDAEGECFRAYESVLESYRDHSNFLRENWRYSECFKLERTDYKGWAEGLRKAGYATNPNYHTLITGIIERFKLHEFDLAPMPEGVKPEYEIINNKVPAVYAQEGETIDIIAKKNDLNTKQIYRYNDLPKGSTIDPGDILYLKPKRRKGSEPYHIVKEGENLYDVSQMYGIKLKQLYKKNHLDKGDEVAPGTTIYLQKKREDKPTVITKEELEKLENEKKLKREQTIKDSVERVKKEEKKAEVETQEALTREFHIIKAGDNLYRISEKYHVFVEDILEWNGIESPEGISVGDKIYLSKNAAIKAGVYKTGAPKKETVKKEEPKKEVPKKEEPKAAPKVKTHTVAKGETAYKICQKYGITSAQLVSWNKLKDASSIREGQTLKVSE